MDSKAEFQAYIADLKAPWKTMGADLETALSIINTQSKTVTELEKLQVVSASSNQQETELQFPDWQSAVEKAFVEQYGLDGGKRIFKKIIMHMYQLSKGTAQQLH